MKGLEVWKNAKNGFTVVRVHYTADLMKDEEWVKRVQPGYTPDQWQQEYEINFEKFSGQRVYTEFDIKNIVDLLWNDSKPILRGWDFGFHYPACLFVQMDELDRIKVLHEELGRDIPLKKFVDYVLAVSQQLFPGAKYEDFCDPAGASPNDQTGLRSVDILFSKGLDVLWRKSDVKNDINLIKTKMVGVQGEPQFLVDRGCFTLVEALNGGYRFKANRDGTISEEPEQDGYYEHLPDCLHYVIRNKCTAYATSEKMTGRVYSTIRNEERLVSEGE